MLFSSIVLRCRDVGEEVDFGDVGSDTVGAHFFLAICCWPVGSCAFESLPHARGSCLWMK